MPRHCVLSMSLQTQWVKDRNDEKTEEQRQFIKCTLRMKNWEGTIIDNITTLCGPAI